MEKAFLFIKEFLSIIFDLLIVSGPLTWAYRWIRLMCFNSSLFNPLARPYAFRDLMLSFGIIFLYSAGLYGLYLSLAHTGLTELVGIAVSFWCGWIGNRWYLYLDKKERRFYRKEPKPRFTARRAA